MTPIDLAHLEECLLLCKEEFEQLVYDKEWFCSDALDLIESSLQIIEENKNNDDST